jgi:hypothetical protein
MRKYLERGGITYPKARSCPNGRQHTNIKMSCLGTVEGGANIFGVVRVKNHDFTPKNHIFPILGGSREIVGVFHVKNHDFTPKKIILRYRYILAPESVLHIPVDYYLSVHNSGKIYLQHHH